MPSFRHRFIRVGIVTSVVAAALVACLLLASPLGLMPTARLLIIRTGELALRIHDPHEPIAEAPICNCSTDWDYRCDSPQLAYYARVRRDARMGHFYDAPRNDLDTYLRYANFLRDAFPHGVHSLQFSQPSHVYTLDLLEMLDEADAGETFIGGEISRMLTQMIFASGGFARAVTLTGHIVVEAWIPELSKWVMIDPDYNLYFSDAAGTPLNAFELHQIASSGRAEEAVAHPGSSSNTLYRGEKHELLVSLYDRVGYRARADWVSSAYPYVHPRRHPSTDTALFYGNAPPPEWGWLQWERTTNEADLFYFTPCRPDESTPPSPRPR